MGRPKVGVRVPWLTDSSRSGTLPRAEGQQVIATAHRHSTGSTVKENDNQNLVKKSTTPVVQDIQRQTPRTQRPAVQVKAEQNCSPALGEKLSPEPPVSATIFSTSPGADGLQTTAPAMWQPSTPPADREHDFDAGGRITLIDMIRELQTALLSKIEPNCTPASASNSTAAVDRVEGEGTSTAGKERFKLSPADLVSDTHLRLKEKADKLQVSVSLFKNRRKAAGLGRWPGRRVRAEMKRAQAPAPA